MRKAISVVNLTHDRGLRSLWGLLAGLLEGLDFLTRQLDVVGFEDVKGALAIDLCPPVQLSRWGVFVKALAFAVPSFSIFVAVFVAHILL